MSVKVAVVGSRDFASLDEVAAWVRRLAAKHPGAVLISGGARGVDRTAEETALELGLDVVSYRPYEYENIHFRPEWSIDTKTWGEAAQAVVVERRRRIATPFFPTFAGAAKCRNGWIVEDADHVVAFWDGSSTGSEDTIGKARAAGKLSKVVRNEELVIAQAQALVDAGLAAWAEDDAPVYDHVWYWRTKLPERKGQPCRVLAHGALNSAKVEFDDGYVTITSRHAVRRRT